MVEAVPDLIRLNVVSSVGIEWLPHMPKLQHLRLMFCPEDDDPEGEDDPGGAGVQNGPPAKQLRALATLVRLHGVREREAHLRPMLQTTPAPSRSTAWPK